MVVAPGSQPPWTIRKNGCHPIHIKTDWTAGFSVDCNLQGEQLLGMPVELSRKEAQELGRMPHLLQVAPNTTRHPRRGWCHLPRWRTMWRLPILFSHNVCPAIAGVTLVGNLQGILSEHPNIRGTRREGPAAATCHGARTALCGQGI